MLFVFQLKGKKTKTKKKNCETVGRRISDHQMLSYISKMLVHGVNISAEVSQESLAEFLSKWNTDWMLSRWELVSCQSVDVSLGHSKK